MSKSILVIDTPERCRKCPMYETGVCKEWARNGAKKFPKDCPLKKVPVKRAERGYTLIYSTQYLEGYDDGHNACIDELLSRSENI